MNGARCRALRCLRLAGRHRDARARCATAQAPTRIAVSRLVHGIIYRPAEVPHRDDGVALIRRAAQEMSNRSSWRGRSWFCCGNIPTCVARPRIRGRRHAIGARRTSQRTAPSTRARVADSETWPVCEDVVIDAIEPLEDPHAAEPRTAQLVTEPASDAVADVSSGVERQLRSPGHAPQDALPRLGHPAIVEIRDARAPCRDVVQRHVQAAVLPVAIEVLPEVRQLQRGAQRVRRSIERRVVEPAMRSTRRPRDSPIAGSNRAGSAQVS